MIKIPRIFRKKIAQPPGTLHIMGTRKTDKSTFSHFHFDRNELTINDITDKEKIPQPKKGNDWYILEGLCEIDLVKRIGKEFKLHPLIQEDILNVYHRPKLEESDDYMFIILKAIDFDNKRKKIETDQVSLVISNDFLCTVHEKESKTKLLLKDRLNRTSGRLRNRGHDYLAYAIMDVIVDQYFMVLESFGEEIERLEDQLMVSADNETQQKIHELKKELAIFKRMVFPLRAILEDLYSSESEIIQEENKVFYRDLYDHLIYVLDSIDMYNDAMIALRDLYIAQVSGKMNEVMKVLTIIATLFIPLTFIAGIYGMNFEHMPELKWKNGYFYVLGVMGVITFGMILYFVKKRWVQK